MDRFSILDRLRSEREVAAATHQRNLGALAFLMDHQALKFCSIGRTHVGMVRSINEDALVERSDAGLWAVSDGMGGHKSGDIASALIVDALKDLQTSNEGTLNADQVREALASVNKELYRRGAERSGGGVMGATIAVLIIGRGKFSGIWAGDSRLYRFRNGKLMRLTRDHRFVQELLDSGALTESEAEHHPRRHVITRAVGVDPMVELDAVEGLIEQGDKFLLATDGVTSVCSDDELSSLIESTGDLEAAADEIVRRCLERGAPDNLTLILIEND